MAKNVELNIKTSDNNYETLYPKILLDNSILSQEIITSLGLDENASFTDALEQLKTNTPLIEIGEYKGTGTYQDDKELVLSFSPKLFVLETKEVKGSYPTYYIVLGINSILWGINHSNWQGGSGQNIKVKIGTMNNNIISFTTNNYFNDSNYTYSYFALG